MAGENRDVKLPTFWAEFGERRKQEVSNSTGPR